MLAAESKVCHRVATVITITIANLADRKFGLQKTTMECIYPLRYKSGEMRVREYKGLGSTESMPNMERDAGNKCQYACLILLASCG